MNRAFQIQQLDSELADALDACPRCSMKPVIWSRLHPDGRGLPQRQVRIVCTECQWTDQPPEEVWHTSLYDAVNYWTLLARLSGKVEQEDYEIDGENPPMPWNL